jgi:DNA-binding IclR family transcriptional regulator
MADMKPVQVLAERHGGLSLEVKERLKRQRAARKAIRKALAEGPRTVAQVADATGLPRDEVLWYLMALKKYREVVEAEEQDDCYAYALAGNEVS